MRVLILCCIGFFLAACGGVSQRTESSRPSARAHQAPTIAGTTWRWNDGRAVEFLPGGRVRFNNYVYGGNWEQHGDSVTFDQNGVMLFDVVIAGNAMSGTWRKLKGDDTRATFPTSLRRTD